MRRMSQVTPDPKPVAHLVGDNWTPSDGLRWLPQIQNVYASLGFDGQRMLLAAVEKAAKAKTLIEAVAAFRPLGTDLGTARKLVFSLWGLVREHEVYWCRRLRTPDR